MPSLSAPTTKQSIHHFALGDLKPRKHYSGGFRIDSTVQQLPTLRGMALSLLTLEPCGVRKPHGIPTPMN